MPNVYLLFLKPYKRKAEKDSDITCGQQHFSSQNFVAIKYIVESFSILSVIIDKTIQIAGPFLAITAIKFNPKIISEKLCCRLLFIIGRSDLYLGETASGKSTFG